MPALEWGGVFYKGKSHYHAGELFPGGSFQFYSGVNPQGAVRALDAFTGEQKWEYLNPAFHIGGLLSTAGGIVFGSQQDNFFALDAKTGRELWRVATSVSPGQHLSASEVATQGGTVAAVGRISYWWLGDFHRLPLSRCV